MTYAPRDYQKIAGTRWMEQRAGIKPVPRCACHMCGYPIARDALWCSTVCAEDYAAELLLLRHAAD